MIVALFRPIIRCSERGPTPAPLTSIVSQSAQAMKLSTLIALLVVPLLVEVAGAEPGPASFAYVLQADAFAKTKAAAVAQLAACGRDWAVLDAAFGGDTPWERADLDGIRRGRAGRQVIAYLSIGEAEDYRPYWRKEWTHRGKLTAAAPAWLLPENPEWKGNYRVKYWNADWQKLMLAAVDDALARGFDGVYLDIVDGFETFEQVGKEYIDDRVNPETKQTYRRDMVDWVKAIAAAARAKHPGALVIPQNGSQLLAHADFLAAISAVGIEDLFTNGNKLQSKSHTGDVLEHLKKIAAAGKPVLLIEYPKRATRRALAEKLAQEHGMIWLITDRPLKTLGVSGR
jgi:cysteinyl-tRNA synthetase, unknown class